MRYVKAKARGDQGRMVYTRGVNLDEKTDAWVAGLIKDGGNFSAWVRRKIMEEAA